MATDLVAAGDDSTDLDVFAPDHNELVRVSELFVRLSNEEQRVLQHYLEHRGRYPVEAIVRQVIPGLTQVTALAKWARWTSDREGPSTDRHHALPLELDPRERVGIELVQHMVDLERRRDRRNAANAR